MRRFGIVSVQPSQSGGYPTGCEPGDVQCLALAQQAAKSPLKTVVETLATVPAWVWVLGGIVVFWKVVR